MSKKSTNYHNQRAVFAHFNYTAKNRPPLKRDKRETVVEKVASRIKNLFKRNKKVA
jgi:hypothetical protein